MDKRPSRNDGGLGMVGKCVQLPKSKVAVTSCKDGGVAIEFYIETDCEEPLFYHNRLEGNVTHTAVKISRQATEALELLLADNLGLLDKNETKTMVKNTMIICTTCGQTLIYESGCVICPSCGTRSCGE